MQSIMTKIVDSNALTPSKGGCPVPHSRTTSPCDKLHSRTTSPNAKIMRNFVPVYPEKMWITQQMFCEYFPFHLIFDNDLRILQAGVHIQRVLPSLGSYEKNSLLDFFDLLHPQVDWNIKSIKKFINMQFVLQTKRDVIMRDWETDKDDRHMLTLRGKCSLPKMHIIWLSQLMQRLILFWNVT